MQYNYEPRSQLYLLLIFSHTCFRFLQCRVYPHSLPSFSIGELMSQLWCAFFIHVFIFCYICVYFYRTLFVFQKMLLYICIFLQVAFLLIIKFLRSIHLGTWIHLSIFSYCIEFYYMTVLKFVYSSFGLLYCVCLIPCLFLFSFLSFFLLIFFS